MSNLQRFTAASAEDPSIHEEIEAALRLVTDLVDEAGTLLQLVSAINERTYQPALQLARAVRPRRG